MLPRAGLLVGFLLTAMSGAASAQDVSFYKGKTVRIVISTGVAGGLTATNYRRAFSASVEEIASARETMGGR